MSTRLVKKKDREVFFFDESRFGTHSRVGHGSFKTGSRSTIKTKLGFKNFYMYTAASPKTGDNFSLTIPNVDTKCMNVYLAELSKEFKEDKIALIMDQAGWHKAKELIIPDNIRILYLPPYSPELNPVERLCLHIKQNVLNNRMYDTLEGLEFSLCRFMRSLSDLTVQSICNANYLNI